MRDEEKRKGEVRRNIYKHEKGKKKKKKKRIKRNMKREKGGVEKEIDLEKKKNKRKERREEKKKKEMKQTIWKMWEIERERVEKRINSGCGIYRRSIFIIYISFGWEIYIYIIWEEEEKKWRMDDDDDERRRRRRKEEKTIKYIFEMDILYIFIIYISFDREIYIYMIWEDERRRRKREREGEEDDDDGGEEEERNEMGMKYIL